MPAVLLGSAVRVSPKRTIVQRWDKAFSYAKNCYTAVYACPKCGQWWSLSFHQIAMDGRVSPPVTCAYPECGFTGPIRLEGWKP